MVVFLANYNNSNSSNNNSNDSNASIHLSPPLSFSPSLPLSLSLSLYIYIYYDTFNLIRAWTRTFLFPFDFPSDFPTKAIAHKPLSGKQKDKEVKGSRFLSKCCFLVFGFSTKIIRFENFVGRFSFSMSKSCPGTCSEVIWSDTIIGSLTVLAHR